MFYGMFYGNGYRLCFPSERGLAIDCLTGAFPRLAVSDEFFDCGEFQKVPGFLWRYILVNDVLKDLPIHTIPVVWDNVKGRLNVPVPCLFPMRDLIGGHQGHVHAVAVINPLAWIFFGELGGWLPQLDALRKHSRRYRPEFG
jgi:hypothetical protein